MFGESRKDEKYERVLSNKVQGQPRDKCAR